MTPGDRVQLKFNAHDEVGHRVLLNGEYVVRKAGDRLWCAGRLDAGTEGVLAEYPPSLGIQWQFIPDGIEPAKDYVFAVPPEVAASMFEVIS